MPDLGIDIGGSSVKFAAIEHGRSLWTAQSDFYARPSIDQLLVVMRTALANRTTAFDRAGICVPGLYNATARCITLSVNMPGLVGISLDELVERVLGRRIARLSVVNDALATATDVVRTQGLTGRTLVLALGTGVGAAVMDDGVASDFSGHIGQIDVSVDPNPPIGPDGGAGSLEAYVGTPALISAYGSMESFFKAVRPADPSMRALARAIRIGHAICRPNHIVLAGGVGARLKHMIAELKKLVDTNLTNVAQIDWTLTTAEHDFHAAIGAALLAADSSSSSV